MGIIVDVGGEEITELLNQLSTFAVLTEWAEIGRTVTSLSATDMLSRLATNLNISVFLFLPVSQSQLRMLDKVFDEAR